MFKTTVVYENGPCNSQYTVTRKYLFGFLYSVHSYQTDPRYVM